MIRAQNMAAPDHRDPGIPRDPGQHVAVPRRGGTVGNIPPLRRDEAFRVQEAALEIHQQQRSF
jgi:hypothetical protein